MEGQSEKEREVYRHYYNRQQALHLAIDLLRPLQDPEQTVEAATKFLAFLEGGYTWKP
jgi:hypothetical protein